MMVRMRAHSRPSQIFQRTKIGMAEMMRVTTKAEKRTLTTISKSIYDRLRIGRKLLKGPSTIMAAAHHMTLRIACGRFGITCSAETVAV
ncbi:Uncharacterised protein [Mycobacterium tuberculosis]|nr:Uncharacterised protein [Mycobacterium tuberculosis]